MATENYTLNRFYFEAKALLEKFGCSHLPGYKLEVKFELEEDEQSIPKLTCMIKFAPVKFDSRDTNYYGFGPSPYICLGSFEETLKSKSGKLLTEHLSVELSE